MAAPGVTLTRKALKTPRAAAVAGILFALLYGTSLALIRVSVPSDPLADTTWLDSGSGSISLALNLVPFSGVAFLWFVGVIRDRIRAVEDRFFATVFLGSGLLFLAMVFAGAALAGGLLSAWEERGSLLADSGVYTFGRSVMYNIVNVYAMRMAGLFMISLGNIWIRTGLVHRAWPLATFALALVLLLSQGYNLWVAFVFPAWVLVVSVHMLFRTLDGEEPEDTVKA